MKRFFKLFLNVRIVLFVLVQPISSTLSAQCTGTINLSATNINADATLEYAYTDENGVILEITNTSSFTDVPEGTYNVYAYQFDSAPAAWAVGQYISSLPTGDCKQLAGPQTAEFICCSDALVVVLNVGAAGCPSNMVVDLNIKNGTAVEIPVGTPVTFYDGDPTDIGAIKLSTYSIVSDIAVGAIERFNDIDIGACDLINGVEVFAVLGDDGSNTLPLDLTQDFNNPSYDECDNTNNKSSIKIKVRCGRFNSMIKK